MKAKEIRELNDAEIEVRIQEEKNHYHRIKFNHAISAVENPAVIHRSKKNIARMKTILAERKKA